MGVTFCRTLANFADSCQWKDTLREVEQQAAAGGTFGANPLAKAANAGI
jgi:hypothetical protein